MVTEAYIPQFRKSFTLNIVLIYIALIENYVNTKPFIDIDYVLMFLLIFNVYGNIFILILIAYLRQAVYLVLDLQEILGIYGIFTLPPEKNDK